MCAHSKMASFGPVWFLAASSQTKNDLEMCIVRVFELNCIRSTSIETVIIFWIWVSRQTRVWEWIDFGFDRQRVQDLRLVKLSEKTFFVVCSSGFATCLGGRQTSCDCAMTQASVNMPSSLISWFRTNFPDCPGRVLCSQGVQKRNPALNGGRAPFPFDVN